MWSRVLVTDIKLLATMCAPVVWTSLCVLACCVCPATSSLLSQNFHRVAHTAVMPASMRQPILTQQVATLIQCASVCARTSCCLSAQVTRMSGSSEQYLCQAFDLLYKTIYLTSQSGATYIYRHPIQGWSLHTPLDCHLVISGSFTPESLVPHGGDVFHCFHDIQALGLLLCLQTFLGPCLCILWRSVNLVLKVSLQTHKRHLMADCGDSKAVFRKIFNKLFILT